jgi:hypothetical protein
MATSTTTANVPDYLEKFYQDNMNNLAQNYSTAQNIYNANSAYTPYTNPRIQGFTNDQLMGMDMVRRNTGVGQDALAGAAARAGQAAQSYSDKMPVTADVVKSYYNAYLGRDPSAADTQNWMNNAKSVGDLTKGIGGSAEASARAAAGYAPDFSKLNDGSFRPNSVQTENYNQALGNNVLTASQAQANLIGNRTPMIGDIDRVTGGSYRADQVNSRMIDPLAQAQGGTYTADKVTADQISKMQQLASKDFSSEEAARYMNPYTQQVTENTTREMMRANDLGRQADSARAAKAGAFGGSRGAIVQAERDRNFGYQHGDMVAKLNQDAFNNAQSQFNTDITRQLDTGKFNVGTEFQRQGQNQAANLQAGTANQAAAARASEFGLNQALDASKYNIGTDLARQSTNQASALQAAGMNQNANAAASQFGLNQNLTAQQANAANQLQRGQLNQAAGLQSLLADQGASNQIGLANQAALNNMTLANEEARQKVFSTNADTFFKNQANSLATQTQNQNMALQGYNANRDQFNTDQQRQLGSGQLAASLAPLAQGMAMQDASNILSIGGQQQALGQQNLTLGYQDFLNQKSQPYENFAFLQNALQGTNYNPYQGMMSQTTNSSDPSKLGQIAGVATTALGVIGGTGGFGSDGWLKSAWS